MTKYNPQFVRLFKTIKSVNLQTELLESFDWDEEKLEEFYEDISSFLSRCDSIDELSLYLSSNYEDHVKNIILQILKDESYDLFLLKGESDD